jgi:hypothetical protein
MPSLTYEQTERKSRSMQRHHARQARMPEDSRPRRSPRSAAPQRAIIGQHMVSLRCCMEYPEAYPNDFRYLYNDTRGDYPRYVWLNSTGHLMSGPHESLPAAISALLSQGWEDASW